MKNFILLITAALCSQIAAAQLYAENNSYIFSKGSDIFVREKVRLRNGSFLYLRGEAQLTQRDDVDNEGSGLVSVYQEGTTNEYTYNYWSSPVSNADTGIDGNVGFSRTVIKYPITGGQNDEFSRAAGNPIFLNAPNYDGITDDGTGGNRLRIAGYWLWNFDSSGNSTTGYAGWIPFQDDNTVLEPGYGFTMKGTRTRAGNTPNRRSFNGSVGQRYDFRGRANNGTITMGVGNDNSTLIGNPYPSAIDLKRFLQENAEHTSGNDVLINPEVRFWESVNESSHYLIDYLGGYGVYSPQGFEAGSNDGFDTEGTYVAPVFRRTDNDGNILTSTAQTGGGSTDGARRYAAVGQGFFVFRTNTAVPATENSFARSPTPFITDGVVIGSDNGSNILGSEISFTNEMRQWRKENGTSSYFKNGTSSNSNSSTSSVVTMTLNVVHNGEYVRPLKMVFHPSTSQDYDHAWEVPVYSRLESDAYIDIEGGEYILSSQSFDVNMRIPLGLEVRSDNDQSKLVEFEIPEELKENFDPAEIYLYDGLSGIYHDIKNRNQFILVQPGHYTDRFEITFTDATLSNPDYDFSGVEIFQNNKIKQLTVLNPDLLDVKDITLYDLAGRLVTRLDNLSKEADYTIGTDAFSTGIYIAKVTTKDDLEKTVKVSISN